MTSATIGVRRSAAAKRRETDNDPDAHVPVVTRDETDNDPASRCPIVTRYGRCISYSEDNAKVLREIPNEERPTGASWDFSYWHCTTCHVSWDHLACERCGVCMAHGRGAQYCSTTCRVYAWKERKAETDNDSLSGSSVVTRDNEEDDTPEDMRNTRAGRERWAAAKMRVRRGDNALSGKVPQTDDEWAVYLDRHIIIRSIDAAEFCADCERDIDPGEPVERQQLGYSSWRRGSPPTHGGVLCAACSTADPTQRRDCDGCGRPTVDRSRHHWVYDPGVGPDRRCFCSTRCQETFYRERRKHRLADARAKDGPRRCAGCDEIMDGQRADARYCSGACRQRAHRQRRAEVDQKEGSDEPG